MSLFGELFGRKVFNITTPYKRCYISIEKKDGASERILSIPCIRSAVFFYQNGDSFYIDSIDDIDKLSYVDYDLINAKDRSSKRFYEDFQSFKEIVKNSLSENGSFIFTIEKKIALAEVIHFTTTIGEVNKQII